jgi:hypothetical protein
LLKIKLCFMAQKTWKENLLMTYHDGFIAKTWLPLLNKRIN